MTDTYLEASQQTWEELATADKFGYILFPQAGQWTAEQVLAHGNRELEVVLGYLRELSLTPDPAGPALDFGCGVGRVTQAMAQHFELAYGVDISTVMLRQAEALNRYPARCRYLLNSSPDLSVFPSESFSFIYSSGVLSHIRPRIARQYLRELVRTLRPDGILVFSALERRAGWAGRVDGLRAALRLRSRAKRILGRSFPLSSRVDYYPLPERQLCRALRLLGARVVDVRLTNHRAPSCVDGLAYLDSPPRDRLISKQYCVVKV